MRSTAINLLILMMFCLVTGVGCSGDDSGSQADAAGLDAAWPDGTPGADSGSDSAVDAESPVVDSGLECLATVGSGSLSGTVQGQTFTASHAGGIEVQVLGLTGYSVGFSPESGTCAELSQTALTLEVAVFLCTTEPGTYAVGSNCLEGPGVSFQNTVKIVREGEDLAADSGTITVETFDPSCGGPVRGSFSADFGGEILTGTFDTIGCGVLVQ